MTVCKLRQEKGVKWHVRVVLCSTEDLKYRSVTGKNLTLAS